MARRCASSLHTDMVDFFTLAWTFDTFIESIFATVVLNHEGRVKQFGV